MSSLLSWFSWSKTDAAVEKVNSIAEEKFIEIIDAVKDKVLKELGTITPSEELEIIYLDILREGCSLFHQIARGKQDSKTSEAAAAPAGEPSTSTTQELTAHAQLFETTVFETVKKYVDRQTESLRLANTSLEQKNKWLDEQMRNCQLQAEEMEHLNGRLKRTVTEQERTIAALRSQVEELRDIQRRVEESLQRISFLEQQERKILDIPIQGQLSPVVHGNSKRKEFLYFPANKSTTADIIRDENSPRTPSVVPKIVEKAKLQEDLLLFDSSPAIKADELQVLQDVGPDGSSHTSSFEDI